jgi:hypothetical protein
MMKKLENRFIKIDIGINNDNNNDRTGDINSGGNMKKRNEEAREPVCEDVGSNGYCDVEASIDGGSNMQKRDDDEEDEIIWDNDENGEAEEAPVSKWISYSFTLARLAL